MRYILLSADNEPTLYEAPDEIAEHLFDYAETFLENIHNPESPFWRTAHDPSGEVYTILCYNEQDFVGWLNKQPASQDQPVREPGFLSIEEREIIMETARKEQYLSYDQMKYPWFNF